MKIRLGFVSNSSSSSYVCDVTGEAFEVNDECFKDAGLVQCVNGHVFKEEFMVPWEPEYPDKETMLAKLDEVIDSKKDCAALRKLNLKQLQTEYADKLLRLHEDSYEVHQNQCPICTMAHIKDSELVAFLLREQKVTRKQIVEEIKVRYGSYEAFQRHLKAKQ